MPAISSPTIVVAPVVSAAYVDTAGAACYTAIPRSTLETMRVKHEGPRFRRVGRAIRYAVADLDAYMSSLPSGGAK